MKLTRTHTVPTPLFNGLPGLLASTAILASRRIFTATLFLSLLFSSDVSAQVCSSSGHGSDGYTTCTRQVIFNTIDNSSPEEDVAYSDYTGISTTVELDMSYDLSVYVNTDGNYTVHTLVWIDWNQDDDFNDAGETYDLGTATNVANGPVSGSPYSVTVPTAAVLGSTTMRVSTKWNSNPSSCETGFDGEVEDYTVVVVSSLDPEIAVSGNSLEIFDGDTSPSVNDHTYFGSADIVSGSVDRVFTISNSGTGSLGLTGNPRVDITGSHASDFTVTVQPDVSISSGGSGTFTVQFDPSANGSRTATISIANDDDDENPYNFNIQGTGTSVPEIDIQGNGTSITDEDYVPDAGDDTDFGNADIYGGANTNTFTIVNSGSGDLTLSGSPLVQLSGSHSGDFSVSQQPASSTVSGQGGTQTFQVTFDPSTTGLRQATITVTSNDADESPYTFGIQGTGTINPEIDILGNGVSITDGDALPTVTDSTDFGTVQIGSDANIVTYTISNTGPTTLNLTGAWPLVSISGSHAGDFSVHSPPASSIASGGSTTFQIAFDPITSGTRSATLTIENDDLNESSYDFAIQGTGQYTSAPLCEIDVKGNNFSIPDGDSSPSATDGTDLGSVSVDGGTTSQTFAISNSGSEDLMLTANPLVSISGAHASDFTVTQQPSSPVAPSAQVTFSVSFNPSAGGTRSAYISIENNDADESPYTFTIEGTGLTAPEISITGNEIEIPDGDSSPSISDSTYFGDVTASLGVAYVTYTIHNSGSTTLNLTGSPRVNIVGDAEDDFTVVSLPSASISTGGSSSFIVAFDPSMVGLRNASVSVTSDDSDESPYAFAIQGNGTGPGSPLACVPNFFHIFGDNGVITYLDATTNPYSYTTIATAGYHINGVGYNLEDGLLYGFEQDGDISGDRIVRIDGTGDITVLTSVTIPYRSWRADFNGSGDMYFWNSSGNEISIFDASEGTVTSHSTGGATWYPIDMAYLDDDGHFYGIHTTTLYEYNPSTHQVSTTAITGRLTDEYNNGTNSAYYGAAWSANDGYLYSTNSQSGKMYKINVSTGESVYVGQAEANLNKSDGASCPLSEAPLPSTGSVGNFVWIDSDEDGIQDASEAGLPGVTVSLYTIDDTFIASTTTDADGEYVFENLSPSEYYIIFSNPPSGFGLTNQNQGGDDLLDSDPNSSTGQTANFDVGVGTIDEGLDAGYTATGVGDFVWNDLDADGLQDSGEPGVQGVTVELLLASNNSVVSTTTTDVNGQYHFSGISANSYKIRISNLPGGYVITDINQGGNDDADSDVYTSSGTSASFTISSGEFDNSIDAGIYQQTSPEMNITGNSQNIVDGDDTPESGDHTDFGSALAAGATVVRTFTIENISGADLTLNGDPSVAISGDHAGDFSVTTAPSTTISSGSSTTFQVTFDPSAQGLRSATISITNNDDDENPYTFAIQGTGLSPELDVYGNGVSIISGDDTPAASDSTDFGEADIQSGSVLVTYKLKNTGGATLTLSGGSPYLSISGTHSAEFSVVGIPASTVAAGDSTQFIIEFNPADNGVREASVSIASDDLDENPFTFDIQGTGTSYPEVHVCSGGITIEDGDDTPSGTDSTDFGSEDIITGLAVRTFYVHNTGSGTLNLTDVPLVQITGTNAGDFIVSQQPSGSTVTSGDSLQFQVSFDPTTTGIRTASITISNDDSDENPYSFSIQGLGTSTIDEEMEVLGNGEIIEHGDTTPRSADFTDMGTAEISGIPTTSTFVIRNVGYAVLNLTGPPPYVDITGTHAAEFSISSSPATSIAIDSATTTFEVTFTPVGLGTRSATISIQNDDADENPYTFAIEGAGIYDPNSRSEIEVKGNMISIPNGDITPGSADGTDFGSVEVVGAFTVSKTYIIHNNGDDDLVLGATPKVTLSGSHASDFTVTSQPASPVAPGSSVSMTIEFDPSATGTREATVSIDNSDPAESPFTFSIQGAGTTEPEIRVSGNGTTISNGDATPSAEDSTAFGEVDANLGVQYVTYLIHNSGSAALTLTGSPRVNLTGTHASDFTVVSQPATPISVNDSTEFIISFDPAIVGTRTATVSIQNDDPNESPYTFDIEGVGTGPGTPISCVPDFYQIYGSTGIISYLDPSTDPYGYTTIATAGYPINGVGYNIEDGLLYGFERGSTVSGDRLVRIDGTGDITVLTSISIPFSSYIGDFNDTGDLYFFDDNNKTQVAIFDVSAGTVSSPTTPSGGPFNAADMAFLDADGLFYGIHGTTLYVFDPILNTISTATVTGKLATDSENGTTFGACWSAADGYIYVSNNTSGRMYKVNVSTYESLYVGTGVATSQNDAASCPHADPPLPSTGTVGNYVWLDGDNDGIQDAGEDGFPNITVSLYDGDDTFISSVNTGSDGSYLFESLAPSEYYLTFTGAPSGFALTSLNQGADDELDSDADPATTKTAIFTIGAGSIDNSLDAGFSATGVGDFVWLDEDEDGIQDPGEVGVPGIPVALRLVSSGATIDSTVTDANGYYSFTGLSLVSHQIWMGNLPAGYAFSPQNQGGDDLLDSDINTVTGLFTAFTPSAGTYNSSQDAGVYQQSEPEMDVKGNFISISDGDNTPSAADSTDFGSVDAVVDSILTTFWVHNISGTDLTLNGSPKVSISGTHADEFVVISQPDESITAGDSSSFIIRFIPTDEGLRSASVSIANTDADENPYNFDIRGFGLAAEIQIEGNGEEIPDGDTTPRAADYTDFGSEDILEGSQAQIFTIFNTGNANLVLTDPAPHIEIGGDHSADFTLTQAPTSPVASNGSTTFTITFNPTAEGIRSATISLANNDIDEDPYTFSIQGIGTATPEIDVRGNETSIANEDDTPAVTDSTEFGSLDIMTDTKTITYAIFNIGSGALNLTGNPIVNLSGAHAGDFIVDQPGSSTLAADGDSVLFTVTFDPTAVGLRSATVSIANNDDNENPFEFSIQGTGVASSEISLWGNSVLIEDGHHVVSFTDSTRFDSTIVDSATSVTYTIQNSGSAILNLTDASPFVALSGDHASDFSVVGIPSAQVTAGGGTTTFRIEFVPSAEGDRNATISIASDDDDEDPYTFTISGYGLPTPLPELTLVESVDLSVAAPGDTLTYTVVYSNVGEGLATNVVIIEDIPVETSYVSNSVTAPGMTVDYSHDGGSNYDLVQTAPVTHIRFTRDSSLLSGGNGTISYKVIVD